MAKPGDKPPKGGKDTKRSLARNRRARFDFELDSSYEAGLVLLGSEVKSLRAGKAVLTDAYVLPRNDELFLVAAQIQPYSHAHVVNHDPFRERKLLLNAAEIRKIQMKIREKGLTVIPLELYLKGGRIKLEIGLGRGRKAHEKRDAIQAREHRREMDDSE